MGFDGLGVGGDKSCLMNHACVLQTLKENGGGKATGGEVKESLCHIVQFFYFYLFIFLQSINWPDSSCCTLVSFSLSRQPFHFNFQSELIASFFHLFYSAKIYNLS